MRQKLLAYVRRKLASRKVRHLETDLAAIREALGCVQDAAILSALTYSRRDIQARLAAARAAFTALHPPGVRFTWGEA